MPKDRLPDLPQTPLDFLAMVQTRGRDPVLNDGILDPRLLTRVDELVAEAGRRNTTIGLETQSRAVLASLREANVSGGFFTAAELAQLDRLILGLTPERRVTSPRHRSLPQIRRPRLAVWLSLLAVLALVLTIFVIQNAESHNTGGTSGQSVGVAPVPAHPLPRTDLEQVTGWLGPWTTIAPSGADPTTQTPAILLLNSGGGTEASTRYSLPVSSSDWQAVDQSTIASGLSISGNTVQFTSLFNVPYVVSVNQAFVLDTDPAFVYRIGPDLTVYQMPATLAKADRLPLSHQ